MHVVYARIHAVTMPCAARARGTAWRLSSGVFGSLGQASEVRRSPSTASMRRGHSSRAQRAGLRQRVGGPLGQVGGRVGCVWAEGILTLRRRVLVVMYLVELAGLIPQHL